MFVSDLVAPTPLRMCYGPVFYTYTTSNKMTTSYRNIDETLPEFLIQCKIDEGVAHMVEKIHKEALQRWDSSTQSVCLTIADEQASRHRPKRFHCYNMLFPSLGWWCNSLSPPHHFHVVPSDANPIHFRQFVDDAREQNKDYKKTGSC